MAVTLRLMRIGKKNSPFYRIVAVDKRKKRNSRYLDSLGFYNPTTKTAQIELNEEKLKFWNERGAEISEGFGKILKYHKRSKGA